jgi:uncharacterized protein
LAARIGGNGIVRHKGFGFMSEDTATQKQVFGFLADPRTHGVQKVARIDTHAASVFLAGDRALKVKRAVRFPFLDYSTLEKRKPPAKPSWR